jgi:hypothetical protein
MAITAWSSAAFMLTSFSRSALSSRATLSGGNGRPFVHRPLQQPARDFEAHFHIGHLDVAGDLDYAYLLAFPKVEPGRDSGSDRQNDDRRRHDRLFPHHRPPPAETFPYLNTLKQKPRNGKFPLASTGAPAAGIVDDVRFCLLLSFEVNSISQCLEKKRATSPQSIPRIGRRNAHMQADAELPDARWFCQIHRFRRK